jgi:branched-chain amino acid transport system ATP-binding protein
MNLRLTGISAGYGDATVLRDVDLTVPAGRVVALLGPNGAGKTTLLRVASGQLRPSAGTVHLAGRDVTAEPPEARAKAGLCLIPEGRGIFPRLTVVEHLQLDGHPSRFDLAYDAFPKLASRRSQAVGTMSGGEQQMVALSRALVSDADVVLLDEVSMGLAPKIVDEVFQFLEVLRSAGRSLLLVEQYVAKALALADYVFLLNRGRITFAGEPAEVDGDALFAEYVGAQL